MNQASTNSNYFQQKTHNLTLYILNMEEKLSKSNSITTFRRMPPTVTLT